MKRNGKIGLQEILLYAIIFFIPYTSFRIAGLKIAEILSILLLGLSITAGKKTVGKDDALRFVISFSICIFASAAVSLADPLNRLREGINEGIFYSFEFGWVLKIFRLLIVYGFYAVLKQNLQSRAKLYRILTIYVKSNVLIDLMVLLQALSGGMYHFGINRNKAMAIEASEAGFINCFAVIVQIFLIINGNRKKRIGGCIDLLVLAAGQICIGSTASIVCVAMALLLSVYMYICKERAFRGKKIIKQIVLFAFVLTGIYEIYTRTDILSKIVNYRYLMNVRGSSIAERISSIKTCWNMFLERPVLGVGFGNFGWYINAFVANDLYRFTPGGSFQPNILYGQLLAELGIAGFLVYMRLLYRSLRKIFRANKSGNTELWLVNMALGLLLYLIVHNMTLTTLYSFQAWITLAIIENIAKSQVGHKNDIF